MTEPNLMVEQTRACLAVDHIAHDLDLDPHNQHVAMPSAITSTHIAMNGEAHQEGITANVHSLPVYEAEDHLIRFHLHR